MELPIILVGKKSPEKHKPTSPNSNLFLYHAPHHTLAGKVKHHLKGKGLAIVGIRIDVASNALATFKSFRLIVSIAMEDKLLLSDMWPCGMSEGVYSTKRQTA